MDPKTLLTEFARWYEVEVRQRGRTAYFAAALATVMVFAGAGLMAAMMSSQPNLHEAEMRSVSWLGRSQKNNDAVDQWRATSAERAAQRPRFMADSTNMVVWGRRKTAAGAAAAGAGPAAAAAGSSAVQAPAYDPRDPDDADDAPDPDVLPQVMAESQGRNALLAPAPSSAGGSAGAAGGGTAAPASGQERAPQDANSAAAAAAAARLQSAGQRAVRAANTGQLQAAGHIARTALTQNRAFAKGAGVSLPFDPNRVAEAPQSETGDVPALIGQGGDLPGAPRAFGGPAPPSAPTGGTRMTPNPSGGGGPVMSGGGSGGSSGGSAAADDSAADNSSGSQTDPTTTTPRTRRVRLTSGDTLAGSLLDRTRQTTTDQTTTDQTATTTDRQQRLLDRQQRLDQTTTLTQPAQTWRTRLQTRRGTATP